jgi:hypothetical protein
MDAIAAIVDGGLLGASDTAYVAKTMLVTSVLSFGALLLAQRLQGGLLGIWLSLKVITTGRVLGGALRLASRKTSPLQKPPKVVAAWFSILGVGDYASVHVGSPIIWVYIHLWHLITVNWQQSVLSGHTS